MMTQRRIARVLLLGLGLTALTARAHGTARPEPANPAPAPPQTAAAVQAPLPADERYAANLGIWYRLEPYGGAFGARLTRYPQAGSAAAQLQFEPGDMIIRLDGQWLYGPNDVLGHVARTDVEFINIRTGRPQSAVVFIAQNTQPAPPPAPYSLGIYTLPAVVSPPPYAAAPAPARVAAPGGAPVNGLRITWVTYGRPAWGAGLQVHDVILAANGAATATIEALRAVTASSGGVVTLRICKGGDYYDVREVVVDMRYAPVPQLAPASPAVAPPR